MSTRNARGQSTQNIKNVGFKPFLSHAVCWEMAFHSLVMRRSAVRIRLSARRKSLCFRGFFLFSDIISATLRGWLFCGLSTICLPKFSLLCQLQGNPLRAACPCPPELLHAVSPSGSRHLCSHTGTGPEADHIASHVVTSFYPGYKLFVCHAANFLKIFRILCKD